MMHSRTALFVVAGLLALFSPVAAQQATPVAAVVGEETCATCHEDVARQFDRSMHGALAGFETRGQPARCESCHGAGSLHAESGDKTLIRTLEEPADPASVNACLACHRQDKAMEWAGSAHAATGVGCGSCHKVHQSRQVVGALGRAEGLTPVHATAPAPRNALLKQDGPLGKAEAQTCYQCHKEQRAQFAQSSHHPVREGSMTCSSCHQVHGRNQGLVKSDERVNDLCTTCHAKQAGPFVFEHAPVTESCLTCHSPHGTVANNLLKQGEPFLCLQCHEMHFHNARVASSVPFSLPSGSSSNPNGNLSFMAAFNTRCSNCHNRVHGSDLPSQGVTGRGKALTK
jgi:predicted CXXCH cytochrome family protein